MRNGRLKNAAGEPEQGGGVRALLDYGFLGAAVAVWVFVAFSFSDNILALVVCQLVFSIAVLEHVDYDMSHPVTIYSVVFLLYSIAYPILVEFGYLVDRDVQGEVLIMHTSAIIVFSVTCIFICRPPSYRQFRRMLPETVRAAELAFWVLFSIALVTVVYTAVGGGAQAEGAGVLGSSPSQFLVTISTFLVATGVLQSKKNDWRVFFLASAAVLLLGFIVVGDRSLLAKLALSVLIVWQASRQTIFRKGLLAAALCGFVAFGLTKSIGGVLFGKEVSTVEGAFSSVPAAANTLLYREFKTSGRITAVVLEFYRGDLHYGALSARNFYDSMVPAQFRQEERFSKQIQRLIADTDVGLGYSIIADSYLNFGYFGIALYMGVLGALLSWMHNISRRSALHMTVYAVSLAAACITVRHGLSGTAATIIKSVIVPLFILSTAKLFLGNGVSASLKMAETRKEIRGDADFLENKAGGNAKSRRRKDSTYSRAPRRPEAKR